MPVLLIKMFKLFAVFGGTANNIKNSKLFIYILIIGTAFYIYKQIQKLERLELENVQLVAQYNDMQAKYNKSEQQIKQYLTLINDMQAQKELDITNFNQLINNLKQQPQHQCLVTKLPAEVTNEFNKPIKISK